jgi:FKBP-type peptidyl-prolyl cis-trans isomerase FkpA
MKIIHLFNAENSFIQTVLIAADAAASSLVPYSPRILSDGSGGCGMRDYRSGGNHDTDPSCRRRRGARQHRRRRAPLAGSGDAAKLVIEMPDGLKYTDTKPGDGATAAAGNKVSVHYTGWLSKDGAKGAKFDSSVDRGRPFDFTLGAHQVIAGWDEGVAGMKVGGQRTLIIPPELGYGSRGAGGVIPPNATLIFDVELLKVQ